MPALNTFFLVNATFLVHKCSVVPCHDFSSRSLEFFGRLEMGNGSTKRIRASALGAPDRPTSRERCRAAEPYTGRSMGCAARSV